MKLEEVIKKPVLTEKSLLLAKSGWYTFWVDRQASKGQVKEALEKMFNVQVDKVRLLNVRGKPKRWGRYFGRIQDRRKALVKLAKGKLDIFEVK